MASPQSSPKELSPEDYVRIFKEGYDLGMPPHDFRVWDRYLFSKCSTDVQLSGLLRVFRTPIMKLGGTPEQNIRTVGQWCKEGTFAEKVKIAIPSTTLDLVDQNFLEENKAIFETRPLLLSEVQTLHQTAWFDQAKDCITSTSPIPTNPETIKTPQWREQERKEAYFAFGMIIWKIMPEPYWVMEDARLDVWYNLGFAIAHQPEQKKKLFERYQKQFSEIWGVSKTTFESFFVCLSNGTMFNRLKRNWDTNTMRTEFLNNLENFLIHKIVHQQNEKSVWRLHQWTYLCDEDDLKMKETKFWGVFEKARVDYALTQNDADLMYRKTFWAEVLQSLDNPLDLHLAIKDPGLHEYLKNWCAEHNKTNVILNRVYGKNPSLSL